MSLADLVLAALLKHAPPGQTAFSVEPATVGTFSSFYGSPVQRETEHTGHARYAVIARELVEAADDILTREKPDGSKLWKRVDLVAAAAGFAVLESGLREDVQVGRGSARKADDVGGRGRGPGGEACLMQVHPAVFAMFAPGGAESLLGTDPEHVRECFRAGMRMLVRARAFCSTDASAKLPGYDWAWATASMFTTGNSCTSSNHGKTLPRARLARRIAAELRRAQA
jgi:hypothetical protein